jgi:hypothetical protein
MFLWMTPMPPSRAMAMAMAASVTVSMAALHRGMLSVMLRLKRVRMSVWEGWMSLRRGRRMTSSKVSAVGIAFASMSASVSGPSWRMNCRRR